MSARCGLQCGAYFTGAAFGQPPAKREAPASRFAGGYRARNPRQPALPANPDLYCMTRRYRLCFPLVGLLVAALMMFTEGAQGQPRPAKPGETPPPSTRRCRWVRLAAGRDTTTFALADTLTAVPTSEIGRAHV